ncbi:MAG TPA: chemotaxis protein CheX, partial [Clostridia bacterium]|nr:chemotaxis protein CheX [Clostridia bacterium]
MNVEYINPFINVSVNLMKMICNETVSRGKVYIKDSTFSSDNVVIIIGVAGEIKGQVFFSMNSTTACNIA